LCNHSTGGDTSEQFIPESSHFAEDTTCSESGTDPCDSGYRIPILLASKIDRSGPFVSAFSMEADELAGQPFYDLESLALEGNEEKIPQFQFPIGFHTLCFSFLAQGYDGSARLLYDFSSLQTNRMHFLVLL
jgi:hypothetical protein